MIESFLAHEIATLATVLVLAICFIVVRFFSIAHFNGFGYVQTFITGMVASIILTVLVVNPLIRRQEKEADEFASEWVGKDLFVNALKSLYEANDRSAGQTKFERIFATHPSLTDRINVLEIGRAT